MLAERACGVVNPRRLDFDEVTHKDKDRQCVQAEQHRGIKDSRIKHGVGRIEDAMWLNLEVLLYNLRSFHLHFCVLIIKKGGVFDNILSYLVGDMLVRHQVEEPANNVDVAKVSLVGDVHHAAHGPDA